MLIDDLSGDEESSPAMEVRDASPDPEATYSQREWAEVLSSAMNELSPGIRRAIQLREFDERSSEETARIMGISVSALKGRMFHGRRKLRERLKRFVQPNLMAAKRTSRGIKASTQISQDQVACNASRFCSVMS